MSNQHPSGSSAATASLQPPAVAIHQPSGAVTNTTPVNKTTQQQFQQSSKRSVLFERASPSWWTVRFDSDILERQHWRSLYSHSKRRFRAALAYVLLASLAWLIYFVALQPGAAWLSFAAGCLLIGLTSLAVLVMSYMQVFLRHAWWLPTWYAILLCCTTALMVVFRNDNLSPITVFCTFVNVLLLLYTVFPLSLGTCAGIGIVFTCVIAVLNIIFHDEHLDEHTFVLPTLLKLILMLLVHVVGVALYVSSQARLRSTFLKVAQSILAKHELGQEKTFVERMIHSVMPPNVAQQIMAGQLQDRRLSSNASVLHLRDDDEDNEKQRNKKTKKKLKHHARRSRGSSCVSSSAAKAAAAMFADPVSQVGGGSPTYAGGGSGGAGHGGGGARGAAGPSIFRPYHMTVMENVSILFADVVGFTAMSSNKTAEQLVNLLNDLFGRFDMLCPKFSCEKISILGDCYYCVSGCPVPRADHAINCVEMGLGMIDAIGDFCRARGERVQMRVGVHTGSVLAGIVGHKRFKFDVFSNDVTLANKMESTGHPGKVHISEKTYEALLPEQRQLFVMEDGPRVDTVNTMFVLRRRTVASNKRRYPASAPALDQLEQEAMQQQPPVLSGYHATLDTSMIAEHVDPAATAATETEAERPKSGRKRHADSSADTNGKKSSTHSSTHERDNSKTRLTPPRQAMPSFQKPSSARTHKSSTSDSTNRAPIDASSSSLNSAGSSNENESRSTSAVNNTTAASAAKQKQQLREQTSSHERVGSFKREGSFKANRRPSLRSQLMEAQLVQNATKILATDISTLSTGELISRRTSKSTSQSPPPFTATPAVARFFNSSDGSNSTVSHSKRDDVTSKAADETVDSLATNGSSSNDNNKTYSSHTKASLHAELRPSPSRSEGTQDSKAAAAAAAADGLALPGSPGGSRLLRKRTSLKGNYSWPGHEEVTIPPLGDDEDSEILTPQQQQDLQRQAEYAAIAAATNAHRASADGTAVSSSRRGSRKSGSPLTANAVDATAVIFATAGDKSSRGGGRHTTDFRPSLQPMQSISPYNATTPTELESQPQFARAVPPMPGSQRQYDVSATGAAVNANQQQSHPGGFESGGDTMGRRASPMRAGGDGGAGKSSAMTAMYAMRRDSVFAGNMNNSDDDDINGRDSADDLGGVGGVSSADSDADDPRDAPRVRYDKLLSRLMKVHKREGEDYFSNPPLHSISLNFLDDDLEHAYRHNFAGRHVNTWTDTNADRMNASNFDDDGESQRLWQHEHHYYYEPTTSNAPDNSNPNAMTAMDNTRHHTQNGGALSHPPTTHEERSPSTSTSIYYGGDNVRTFSSNKFNTFIDLVVASVLLSVIVAVCIVVASAAYLSMPFLFVMPIAFALQVFVLLPSAYLIYQPTLTDDKRKQSTVTISMDELGSGAENDAAAATIAEDAAEIADESANAAAAVDAKKQQLRRERAERRRRRSSNFLQRLSKYFYWNQTWYARHAVGAVLMLLPCAVVWSTFNCEQLCKLMEPCDANIFFCLTLFTAFLNFCNFAQLSSWLRTGVAAVVCLVFVMMVSFNICSTFGSSGSGVHMGVGGSFNSSASTMSPTVWTLPSRFNTSNRQLAVAARAAAAASSTAAVTARRQQQNSNSVAALSPSSDYNDFTTLRDNEYDSSNPENIAVQKFVPVENKNPPSLTRSRIKRFLFDAAAVFLPSRSAAELFINTATPAKSMTRDDAVASANSDLGTRYNKADADYAVDYEDDDNVNVVVVKKTEQHAATKHNTKTRKRAASKPVAVAAGSLLPSATTSLEDYNFVSRTSATVHSHSDNIYNSSQRDSDKMKQNNKEETKKLYDAKSFAPMSSTINLYAAKTPGATSSSLQFNDGSSMVMNIKDVFTHYHDGSVARDEDNNKSGDADNDYIFSGSRNNNKSLRTEKNSKLEYTEQQSPFVSRVSTHEQQHTRSRDKSIRSNRKWLVPAAAAHVPAATQAALYSTPSSSSYYVHDDDNNAQGKKFQTTQWAAHLITHAQSAPPAAGAQRPSFRDEGVQYINVSNRITAAAVAESYESGFVDSSTGSSGHRPFNTTTPKEFIMQTTFKKNTTPRKAEQNDEGRDLYAAAKNNNATAKSPVFARSHTLPSHGSARTQQNETANSIIENDKIFYANKSVMPSLVRRSVRQAMIDAEKSPDVTRVNPDNNCLRYFADIIQIDERTLREGRGIVDQEAWYWRLFHHASPVQYEAIFDALLLLILISFLNRESEIIYRLSFHADSLATRDRETILEMKTQADLLLHNIIPQPVVAKLKETNGQYSENMSNAAVIFASVTNFSGLYAEDYAHGREFLRFLNELIGDFDSLLDKPEFKPHIHKIKTIGATYMAAAFPATALANKPSPAPGAGGGGGSSGGNLGVGGKRTSQAISIAGGAAQYRSQLSQQQQQARASMPGGGGDAANAAVPVPRAFPSANVGSTTSPSRTLTQRPSSGTAKSPLQSPVRSPSLMFSDAGGGGGATPKRGSGDAGGVDESRLHQYALMDFAIALQDTVREFNKDMLQYEFKIRIGYNIGEVTAGVLGTQKMYFDIWGDAVNLASRMDSTGVNGEIQVEEGCMLQLQDMYEFRPREGGVYVKGKGEMKTDFLVRKRPKRLPKAIVQVATSPVAAGAATKSTTETVPGSGHAANFTITNL